MAKRSIYTQFARYEKEYLKRAAKTAKYGLKPSQAKYNLIEFETEVITLRHQPTKIKDITSHIAKQQTAPFTSMQISNLMQNAIVTDASGNNTWNPKLQAILDTLGKGHDYDNILNDKSHDRTLKLTKMVTEVYGELKDYLDAHPGETEVLSELIGEAFWGS